MTKRVLTKVLFFTGLILLLVCCCIPWGMFYWEECAIPLPDERYQVFLQIKGAHPFLDESYRRLRISGNPTATFLPVHLCPGGCDIIEFYWFPASDSSGPHLRILDQHWETVIDLGSSKSFIAYRTHARLYLGEFEGTYFSMGTMGGPNGESQVIINGKVVSPYEGSVAEGPGELLGCVNEDDAKLDLKPCGALIP